MGLTNVLLVRIASAAHAISSSEGGWLCGLCSNITYYLHQLPPLAGASSWRGMRLLLGATVDDIIRLLSCYEKEIVHSIREAAQADTQALGEFNRSILLPKGSS